MSSNLASPTKPLQAAAEGAGVVPAQATAPALLIVGYLMTRVVREIRFADIEDGFPALLTLTVMPFTYSITNGIGAGFVVDGVAITGSAVDGSVAATGVSIR